MEATDWFRVRHPSPFPPEAVAAFRASCAVFRSRMQAILEHWDDLPATKADAKPTVVFLEPEVSSDGRTMSLSVRIEGRTLGVRSIFQSTASRELYAFLPMSVQPDIEVGVTEPAFDGPGWRHDWWSPHLDNSIKGDEVLRRTGFRLKPDPENPAQVFVVPGWRVRLRWALRRLWLR